MRSMAVVLTLAVAVALLTVVAKVDGACTGLELNECMTGVGEGSASSSCCSAVKNLMNSDISCFCSVMKEDSNMGGYVKAKLSDCNVNFNSVCSSGSPGSTGSSGSPGSTGSSGTPGSTGSSGKTDQGNGSAESILKFSYTAMGFTMFIWLVLLVLEMEGGGGSLEFTNNR